MVSRVTDVGRCEVAAPTNIDRDRCANRRAASGRTAVLDAVPVCHPIEDSDPSEAQRCRLVDPIHRRAVIIHRPCPEQAIRSDAGIVGMSLWSWLTRLVREQVDSYKSKGPGMLFVVAHPDVLAFHEARVGVKEESRRGAGFCVDPGARTFDVCEADKTTKVSD
jgi:hypothetical protein